MKRFFLLLTALAGLATSLPAAQKVVGYYANWSMYSATRPLLARDIPIGMVTDINYAFMRPDEQGNIYLSDPWADIECHTDWKNPNKYPYWGNLRMLVQLKAQAAAEGHPIRTFFSVGGWGPYSTPFSALAANPTARAHFAQQAIQMCETYRFDGLDVDWEYPSTPEDAANFLLLLRDLHTAFKAHNPALYLTVAAPAGYQNFEKIDWKMAAQYLDTIHLMTYDYAGAWDAMTLHQAPLSPSPQMDPRFNTTSTLQDYLRSVPPEKLTVGIPFYFRTYTHATAGTPNSHYGSPHSGAANPAMPQFYQVMGDVASGAAKLYWDPTAQASSAYYPATAIYATGSDPQAITATADFIRSAPVAGAMIWELGGDTPDWQALGIINDALSE